MLRSTISELLGPLFSQAPRPAPVAIVFDRL